MIDILGTGSMLSIVFYFVLIFYFFSSMDKKRSAL